MESLIHIHDPAGDLDPLNKRNAFRRHPQQFTGKGFFVCTQFFFIACVVFLASCTSVHAQAVPTGSFVPEPNPCTIATSSSTCAQTVQYAGGSQALTIVDLYPAAGGAAIQRWISNATGNTSDLPIPLGTGSITTYLSAGSYQFKLSGYDAANATWYALDSHSITIAPPVVPPPSGSLSLSTSVCVASSAGTPCSITISYSGANQALTIVDLLQNNIGIKRWISNGSGTTTNIQIPLNTGSFVATLVPGLYTVQLSGFDASTQAWTILDSKNVFVTFSNGPRTFTSPIDDLYANFWTGSVSSGHVIPTDGNGIATTANAPGFNWPASTLVDDLYYDQSLPTQARAAQSIAAEWNFLTQSFTDNQLTACGNNSANNFGVDDTGWNAQMFIEIYDTTHDPHALSVAEGAIQCAYARWSDTTASGAFNGLWYSDPGTYSSNGVTYLSHEKSLYAVGVTNDAIDVYQITHDAAYLTDAQESYNWMQQNLLRSDGLYWADYGTTTPSASVAQIASNNPVAFDRFNDINQAGSVTYLGGDMAMSVIAAKLYQATGNAVYQQNAINAAQALLNSPLITNSGQFLDDRDAWANGSFVNNWVENVVPLLPQSSKQQALSILANTSQSIEANDRTPDGYYGGCWQGPISLTACAWALHSSLPQQIMTSATAVDFTIAAMLTQNLQSSPNTVAVPIVNSGAVTTSSSAVVTITPAAITSSTSSTSSAATATYATTTSSTSSPSATLAALQEEVDTLTRVLTALIQSRSSTPNACTVFNQDLALGSSGNTVRTLQKFFVSVGILQSSSVTGYYGALTQKAVMQWQIRAGILSNPTPTTPGYGSVGPRTRASIAASCKK